MAKTTVQVSVKDMDWGRAAAQRIAELEADLATARAVAQRLLDHWQPHEDNWNRYHPHRPLMVDDADEPMSDAERAWLASVSPPTSEAP